MLLLNRSRAGRDRRASRREQARPQLLGADHALQVGRGGRAGWRRGRPGAACRPTARGWARGRTLAIPCCHRTSRPKGLCGETAQLQDRAPQKPRAAGHRPGANVLGSPLLAFAHLAEVLAQQSSFAPPASWGDRDDRDDDRAAAGGIGRNREAPLSVRSRGSRTAGMAGKARPGGPGMAAAQSER
jgi:hypothetical protein